MKVLWAIRRYGLPLNNMEMYNLLNRIGDNFIKENSSAITRILWLPEHINLDDYMTKEDLYKIHLHGLDSCIEFEHEAIQTFFDDTKYWA